RPRSVGCIGRTSRTGSVGRLYGALHGGPQIRRYEPHLAGPQGDALDLRATWRSIQTDVADDGRQPQLAEVKIVIGQRFLRRADAFVTRGRPRQRVTERHTGHALSRHVHARRPRSELNLGPPPSGP